MASKRTSRRCAREGCRAWAVRGGALCVAHRGAAKMQVDAGDLKAPDARRERDEAFADRIRQGRHAELIDAEIRTAMTAAAADLSLQQEIGVLRVLLQRVIASDLLEGDTREVVPLITRLVETTVRTVRMQHTLGGDKADDIATAVTRILTEIGLGDEP